MPHDGALTSTTDAVGDEHDAEGGPQQERVAGHRQAEHQLHEVAGARGPERAEQDAAVVVGALEHERRRADRRPRHDAVEQQHAEDADARRELQRVVVHVVGHREVAGVGDVLDRLVLGEDEPERVGAEAEDRPVLDRVDRGLPDLEARLAAAVARTRRST